MKKTVFGIFMCLIILSGISCGKVAGKVIGNVDNGDPVVKTVNIGDFDKVEIATGIEMVFSQSKNTGTAKVETYSKLEKRLVVKTEGKTLKVYFNNDGSGVNLSGKTTVTVSSPDLKGIEVSSAGGFISNGDIMRDGMIDIEVSSAGKVKINKMVCSALDVECSSTGSVDINSLNGNLDADVSSSGNIKVLTLEGTHVELDASSTGSIDINRVKCNTISADSSSASDINLNGIDCDMIDADASSASKIVLEGKCKVLKEEQGSAGKVKHSNLKIG